MVNARDSTHLIPDLRFAPGIKWEVPGGEYVDEPVLYWLQRGSGVELSANPPTIGFANSEIEDTAIVSVATFAAGVFENFATSCLNSFAGALTNSGTSVLLNLADAPTIGTRALGNWECTFTNSETGALANLGGLSSGAKCNPRRSEWETRLFVGEPMLSTGLHFASESTGCFFRGDAPPLESDDGTELECRRSSPT
jgi:hypothetical protein